MIEQPTIKTDFNQTNMEKSLGRILLTSIITAAAFFAWTNRFIQDDAFISLRYAENLATGNGLVFNPGEYVEGYTNFLWTLLTSAAFNIGVNPVLFSYALGVALFVGTLIFTYRLAFRLSDSTSQSLVVTLLLGFNYSFNCYATGGLETQLQAFLIVVTTYLCVDLKSHSDISLGRTLVLSILLGAGLLTRLDTMIVATVIIVWALISLPKRIEEKHRRIIFVSFLLGPLTIVLISWLSWKISYYGDILPNTFYVKAASGTSLIRGLVYLFRFLESYWLIAVLPIILFGFRLQQDNGWFKRMLPLTLILTLWLAYTIKVGGDFMEFRFLVPMLPFFFIIFTNMLWRISDSRRLKATIITIVFVGSFNHAKTFPNIVDGIESIPYLQSHLDDDGNQWRRIGLSLKQWFENDNITIAATAIGAISYYSKLTTIDMHGLTDKWVAKRGLKYHDRPGHQRISTAAYLRQRRTHIVIGHPLILKVNENDLTAVTRSTLQQMFTYFKIPDPQNIPSYAQVVEAPIDASSRLYFLYLTPHPAIDAKIRENHWRTWPATAG